MGSVELLKMSIAVLVVGDVGRSPRMQNHALEIARHYPSKKVYLIGYDSTPCSTQILNTSNLNIVDLEKTDVDRLRKYFPTILGWALFMCIKVVFLSFFLFWRLFCISNLELILMQSPPAIPGLPIAWFVSRLKGAKLVVDIHNYGYSIMALKVKNRAIIGFAAFLEKFFTRQACATLTVSQAMSADVSTNWKVSPAPVVVYDLPPTNFQPPPLMIVHDVLCTLLPVQLFSGTNDGTRLNDSIANVLPVSKIANESMVSHIASTLASSSSPPRSFDRSFTFPSATKSLLTQVKALNGKHQVERLPRAKPSQTFTQAVQSGNAPFFGISCTSWTPDEDFDVLLYALERYDRAARRTLAQLPPLLIAVTGRGQMRDEFFEKVKELKMTYVAVVSLFVPADLYPAFVGCADFGICMHQSSSGLDLPMKVVDMLGAGLPVLARNFNAIGELLHEELGTARLFDDSDDLFEALSSWLCGGEVVMKHDKAIGMRRDMETWSGEWKILVKPLFDALMSDQTDKIE
eukprot:GDKJ01058249.1.p1 GENE.GDKJ01058249.1~~GDKJ01058249.1.p1  ORF type:complete len:518 (-),score=93.86 GDKJ01058249.1:41-1594(-)